MGEMKYEQIIGTLMDAYVDGILVEVELFESTWLKGCHSESNVWLGIVSGEVREEILCKEVVATSFYFIPFDNEGSKVKPSRLFAHHVSSVCPQTFKPSFEVGERVDYKLSKRDQELDPWRMWPFRDFINGL